MTPRKPLTYLLLLLAVSLTGCASETKQAPKNKAYSFWPAAPDEPRVQFLTSYTSSGDLTEKQSSFEDSIYGKADVLPITKPYGVAMSNGKVYVCDIRSRGVTILDLRQRVTRVMGSSGVGVIEKAVDIAIGPDGYKYVVDSARAVVVVFGPDDKFAAVYGPKDFNPISVAVFGEELYVADFRGQCVKVMDRRTGKVLRKIGEPGPDDGQFVRPITVRVSPKGNVCVIDVMKCRVQEFTRDGKFLFGFGQMGNRPGDLVRPKHMSFDKNGFMYVVDAAFNNVQVFDEEGKVVDYFGSAGEHPGAMDLPAGIFVQEGDLDLFKQFVHPAFQAERLLVVTNQFGPHRVAIYAQGHLKNGSTVADILPTRAKVGSGTQDPNVPATMPSAAPVAMPTTAPAGVGSQSSSAR